MISLKKRLFSLNLYWPLCLCLLLGACSGSSKATAGSTAVDSAEGGVASPKASEKELFKVSVTWSADLAAGTLDNQAEVRFWNQTNEALTAELTSFKLFMQTMGHGSIKTSEMQLTQDSSDLSHWTVKNIYFSMGGGVSEWVVDITATVEGQSDKVRVAVPSEVN